MRLYGVIQTKLWTNAGVQKISDQAKLLACYLLSSSHTNMLGCFRIPVGYIAEDLQWNNETVNKAFDELYQINYLTYDVTSGWVFIHNFLKYNPIENPNQGKSIAKLFEETPRNLRFFSELINSLLEHSEFLREDFRNTLETLVKPFRNQDQEQNQNQEEFISGKPDIKSLENNLIEKKLSSKQIRELLKTQALEVLEFLNEKTGRAYRPVDTNLSFIIARLNSGATIGQCFQVIAKKYREWKDNHEMAIYLRPETLFNKKKFESYLGELGVAKSIENAHESKSTLL